MDRTKFYNQVEVDGILELDKIWNNLSFFTINYPTTEYRVVANDLLRPDLISFKVYSSVNFWWLIMFVNSIYNIFEDLYVGQKLTIPSQLDVYDFYKKYAIR